MRRLRGATDTVKSRRLIYWRATLLPAGLLLMVVALSGTGFGGWRLLQSVKRRSLIQHCRDQGQILADRILDEAQGGNRESLVDVATTESFTSLATEVVNEHEGIVYMHLVEPGGRIIWSSKPRRVGKEWWGGHLGDSPAPERQGKKVLEPPDTSASVEIVVPIHDGRIRGAIVMGLSQRRLSHEVMTEFATMMLLLSASIALIVVGLFYAHQYLTLRLEGDRRQSYQESLKHLELMAAGLAHEIKNPLNALRFASDSVRVLSKQVDSPATRGSLEEITQDMNQEVEDLNRTVSSFLSYARPEPGDRQETDVKQVCEATRSTVSPELEQRGVELVFEMPHTPVVVHAVPVHLKQVLINLLLNAAQASQERGRATLRAAASDRHLRLEVEDDAPGVPDELRDRLFEPFASGRPNGTGLGLAICRRLVTDMDGTIAYQPRAPVGSAFIIELPIAHGTASRQ